MLKKEYFLEIRKAFNSSESTSLESAAYLYALNKLCFNGLYRENSRGEFNVPFGQKNIFPALELAEVKDFSFLLRNTKIMNSDFETTTKIAKAGDFIYFDPPYVPVNTTSSFTSYQAVGFGIEDQKRLAELMVDLAKNGIRAMCSNSDTPVSRDIYKELDIRAIQAPRMVSAKASGRGSISELLVTNY
jgi:DNA adenine methylase